MRRRTHETSLCLPLLLVAAIVAGGFPLPSSGQNYTFQNYLGTTGGAGATDDPSFARFSAPWGIARDAAGNLYVTNSESKTIRVVSPANAVTTLAGLAWSNTSTQDGVRAAARFSQPRHITIDPSGILYLADGAAHAIRRITPAGEVTTLAGTLGLPGSVDGAGAAARFNYPTGIAYDSTSASLYVTDQGSHTVRKVTLGGVVTTLAGLAGSSGSSDGTGSAARFLNPAGVAVDSAGNVFVSDGNHIIRKITPAGVATIFAGGVGDSNSTNGNGTAARFANPQGLAIDSANNIYVADSGNAMIRKITPSADVTTLAGGGGFGHVDATGAVAKFFGPTGVTADGAGNVYVTELYNLTVRKVTAAGVVTTLAGMPPLSGSTNAGGLAARFRSPRGLAFDGSGNLYVGDTSNYVIRKITPAAVVSTYVGTAGSAGSADGTGASARFYLPSGVDFDAAGNLYVAEWGNHTIRKVTTGLVVTTIAGTAGSTGTTNATGAAARFNQPLDVAVDGSGNVYVADFANHAIRKITTSTGAVTTFAGLAGTAGALNGTTTAARFEYPASIARDPSGNFYVADHYNQVIRKITAAGVVTTFAGDFDQIGTADGTGTAARFYYPQAVATDSSGNVYVAELYRATIRKITPAGVVTTIGAAGFEKGNEEGTGSFARFTNPIALAVDSSGRIYVSDYETHNIRRGSVALDAAAVIDAPSGQVFVPRQLNTSPNPGTSYSWSIVRKPTGSTAALSSTSTANPTFTPDLPDVYTFRLSTADGSLVRSITTVSLTATCPALSIGPLNLPHPTPGVAYSQTISAGGGTAPYSFTISSGSVPPGLSLSAGGALTGTTSTLGTYPFTVRATDASTCFAERQYTLTVSNLAAPSGLVATWNSVLGQAELTWAAVPGATGYRIYRRDLVSNYAEVGTSATNSFIDPVYPPQYVNLFKVRAYDGGGESGDSNLDLLTAAPRTVPVAGVTTVSRYHFDDMRQYVNALSAMAGLPSPAYTDISLSGGVIIKAVHLTEIRNGLNAARSALGLSTLVFTDPSPAGVVIKGVHLTELLDGVH